MKKYYVWVFLFLVYNGANSQNPKTPGQQNLSTVLQNLLQDPDLKHGLLGFELVDVKSGKEIESHNAHLSFLPASTFKTIASGAALSLLGADYRFKTYVETDGKRKDNTLFGNIYLRGTGDPTFGSGRTENCIHFDSLFRVWADSVYLLGIRKIEGRIIGDASWFDDANLPETWTWNDMGNYYGAGPSGLTIHENSYTVYFKPSKYPGQPAQFLKTEPVLPDLEIINEMRTGAYGSSDNGYIYGAPYTNLRYFRGTVPAGNEVYTIKGSIPEPALFAAQEFEKALKNRGIEVKEPASSLRLLKLKNQYKNPDRTVVFVYYGPKLSEIVYWSNKRSLNLYAENVFKSLGKEILGEGTAQHSEKVILEFFKRKGIDSEGMNISDGSGLSRHNLITPQQMTSWLVVLAQDKNFPAFYNSLPIAGDPEDPGTASSIGIGTSIAGNLRAKSGFISGVRGYAGYVKDKSGDLMAFYVIANHFTCGPSEMRKKLEKVMVALGELE